MERSGKTGENKLQPKKLGVGAWVLSRSGLFLFPRVRFVCESAYWT